MLDQRSASLALSELILEIMSCLHAKHLNGSAVSTFRTLREKQFVATGLFLGAAGIGAAPIVACSGSSTAATPYKWHSRGG